MKKIIFFAALCLCSFIVKAQVTNQGNPASFSMVLQKTASEISMPSFDLEKIKEEDKVNDQIMGKPYRFGHEFKVDLNIKKEGTLDVLPNGDHVYRLGIYSKGAKTLNFVFNKYKVPTGATIYLYNDDKSDVLGAYTNVFNRADEMLGTWMVAGEKVWIEYREPKNVIGQGDLNLGRVIHGYRSITDADVQEKALNDSGDCNQDVDCPVGADFDDIKDRLKHSVAFIIMQGFVCSGNLINNVNNDGTPYFLTANHCDAGPESTWAFRFNWISPNPSCSTTTPSTDAPVNQTTSGATRLATNSESDVRLLRLDGGLNDLWDLEFAGWDRSGNTPPSFTIGIHHPSGDIMKVCRENNPVTKTAINFNGNTSTEMWNVADWDLGVTEGGSSGSALFDSNGRIIGQLAGGAAACNGTNDNNQFDVYGRFDISWNFGTTDATRLSNWLDPDNTGVTVLNSISYNTVLGVEENKLDSETTFYPNPSNGIFNVANNSGSKLTYTVFSITGKKVGAGEIADENTVLNMSSNVSGVYFVTITNTSNSATISKKVVINK
ncbi:T9SS type A sorting domain-containing protein [Aquimarina litoralis]|uniref:T9SS type A sorting domain-containing protein n=1 Tax=Aquimarina litoralis TaxID=584605 RepID=UPI001C58CF40|nr:T9SS type A sorting domain-containing protein [Aquimarina litoralis]MBW1295341.1 T9SS type A sorting domain-containing protein [Aquimarina litoralis]